MSRKLLPVTIAGALLGTTALADAPSVAVDIAPVHSLVARVMDGVGTPDLVIPPGASPHEHTLRPSEAAALENADIVFWIGEDLTPWLESAVETLAAGAAVTALLETDGITLLDFREDALFEAHEHDGEEKHEHEDHADEEHDEHEHEDHAEEDHDDHDHEGHAHEGHDPHAWLSPDNAATWLNVIAAQLSAADPDNAATYYANAAAGREEIEALQVDVSGTLDPVRGQQFVAFHDAYQYFEVAFDFPAAGAISLSDATDPSPARIAEIRERVQNEGIDCVLAEPQYNEGLVATVMDGTVANTAVVDPLGAGLELGPGLYPQLLKDFATTLATCLE
ncbi:MAG: zinc ABC transporter substrate-binding protein [Paracoccaceae bacterium]|nr:zinc ABC transporter substrate-binding protein [Paracoccaceae bacterium]